MKIDVDRPLLVDIHLHTVNSGHAFSTLAEYIAMAREKGVKIVGIADHGPSMEGAPTAGYFSMVDDVRRVTSRYCTILFGCELNILSEQGDVDLDSDIIARLDYTFAGLHSHTPYAVSGASRSKNTEAIVNCIQKVRPTVISHPITALFPVEIRPIVEASAVYGVALEVNARVFRYAALQYLIQSYVELLEMAFRYHVSIILSSDSHISFDVGDIRPLAPLQEILCDISEVVVRDEETFMRWRDGANI